MTDEEVDRTVQRVIRVVFSDDQVTFEKSMWRMTGGSHEYSFEIARNICLRYGFLIDEEIFDMACAILTGGCEVEWETWETPNDIKQSRAYQRLLEETEEMKQKLKGDNSEINKKEINN